MATLYWDYKVPGLVLPLKESLFFDANLTNELALAGVIIGLMIIVFAREKIEDEYISLMRLKCLQWSVLISFVILFILNFMFYGGSFYVVLIYNMFTIPLIFIAKFNYSLYRLRREREEDEK